MISASYRHSAPGTFLFKLCTKWTMYLVKHRVLYYLLACTWGILLTLIGWLISLVMLFMKVFSNLDITFTKYYWVYKIETGPEYWGGFETGLMFVRDHKSTESLNQHEFGHTFQNTLFGPLFPILVGLPSIIRYWYQFIRERQGKANKAYDAIWFEDAATQCGIYATKYLSNLEVDKCA